MTRRGEGHAMFGKSAPRSTGAFTDRDYDDDLRRWALRLPWVIERRSFTPGVHTFAVDCEPLGVRRMWLVTGLGNDVRGASSVAVILPDDVAQDAEQAGTAWRAAALPAGHVLMKVRAMATPKEVDDLVLAAYNGAFT